MQEVEDTMVGIRVTEGIAAILFGIAAVFWPGLTTLSFLYLFAAFILVSGIINLIIGIFHFGEGFGSWVLKLVLSLLQIGVGVYLLRHPHVSFSIFVLLLGFMFIFRGVFEIVAAFMDDFLSTGTRVMFVLVGALATLAGIYVLFQPVSGGIAFVWAIGLYALISGPIIIASALSDRKKMRELHTAVEKSR